MRGPSAGEEARKTARRQLRRVLLVLAGMDIGVLVFVFVLGEARGLWHLANAQLLALVVGGIGLVLLARLIMAIRLRPKSPAPAAEAATESGGA